LPRRRRRRHRDATGATSEAAVRKLYRLPDVALIDMGDFAGGMLRYLRRHPLPRLTIAGGVAKLTKLAQGLTDLHSRRGEVDLARLARFAAQAGGSQELAARIASANTAAQAYALAQADGVALGAVVARAAQETAGQVVAGTNIAIEIVLFDRDGRMAGRAPFASF
jgi:cobalt-precorrin-5B (C1)-methyltransferase